MKREIKEKLEEIVALLNDPEETVLEKEVKEKLEVVMSLLQNPEEIAAEKVRLQEKLDRVMMLVNQANADPEIDIECHMPELETREGLDNVYSDPYILVTYNAGEYDDRQRKIRLRDTAIKRNTPESLANQVTFSIEEFKGDIDSVEMG